MAKKRRRPNRGAKAPKSKKRIAPQKRSSAKTRPASAPPIVAFYREKQRVRTQIAKDRAARYAKFLQEVKKPTEPPKLGVAMRAWTATAVKQPLRILAEGDSWFEYPLPWPKGDGVIVQLEKLLGYSIANMAHHGLEVGQIMGLSIRQEIISKLTDLNVKFDALLFSGGGDDLVGDRFCIWLKDSPPAAPPEQMVDSAALQGVLAVLEAEYRELIDLRDQCSPETVIFTHAYDFPKVTGKGVCGEGPWLKPSLDFAYQQLGVQNPSADDEFKVVKIILQRFRDMLAKIASDPSVKNFVLVPTQGKLQPNDSDWQNEIHPSTEGFIKIAEEFRKALAAKFP